MASKARTRRAFGEEPTSNGKTGSARRWYGRFMGPDGNRHGAGHGFHTKGAVEAWYQEQAEVIDRMTRKGTLGAWMPPKEYAAAKAAERAAEAVQEERDAVTVADLFAMWVEHKAAMSWEETTREAVQNRLDYRLLRISGKAGEFRNKRLVDVTRRDAADWWDAVWSQFPDTVSFNNTTAGHVKSAFAWAVRRDMIPANPIDLDLVKKKRGEKRHDLPTSEEAWALVSSMPDRYKFPTALALFHGLRSQEVLGLRRWQIKRAADGSGWVVDLSDRKRVKASVRLRVDGHYRQVDKGLKTEDSYRVVPVFAAFNEMLETHLDKFVEADSEAMVVTTRTGARLANSGWNRSFSVAADRYARGLKGVSEEEREAVRLRLRELHKHDGRRFAVTGLLELGTTAKAAGAFVGDREGKVLREHYMRYSDEHLAEGVAALGARVAEGRGE